MSELRERIEALPGMDLLLPALQGLAPAYLVGGAVRDLLRGADAVDLDVAVEGDAGEVAHAVAERVRASAGEHERFGTAYVFSPRLKVDFATTRRERYPSPGALPEVEPAGLIEDLGRRDFTINAMAAGLSGEDLGTLHDPLGGESDLAAGVIRVMQERSFLDDPTRLLRALRYEARLHGRLDSYTQRLAREAIEGGAMATVSGPRVRDELMDLLGEHEAPAALARMRELGLDTALHPSFSADPDTAASAAAAALETGADPALAALAILIAPNAIQLMDWLERLALGGPAYERVARAALVGTRIAGELRADMPASRVYELLHREPEEALAVALARGAPGEPVLRYLADLRDVRLEITGVDLIAAGVPESPAIGRALEETLRRKLDGEVAGLGDELELALRLAKEGQ